VILLDSDIAIDILRRSPPATAWISSVQDNVCLPGIVALELYQGCRDKREVTALQKELAPFAILWPSDAACDTALTHYAKAHLTNALGLLDALIAATALTYSVSLHTFNQKHFAAVPGLQTIQPYTR
jgi:predicted nucleic acid-binding protein